MLKIKVDDLTSTVIADFLEEHIQDMLSVSPPESAHVLDLDGLRKPEITFYSMWDGEELVGCAALSELSKDHGEIKSMRMSKKHRGKGLGSQILEHIITQSEGRGYKRLSLETGSMSFFDPATALYKKYGFQDCPPFADYELDPYSIFMTKEIEE